LQPRHFAHRIVGTVLVTGGILAVFWLLSGTASGGIKTFSAFFLSQLKALFLPLIVGFALFSLLEWHAPAGPRKSFKDAILACQIIIAYVFAGSCAGFVGSYLASALRDHFRLGWIDLRFISGKGVLAVSASALVSTLAFDFVAYWYHRLQHTVPFLWQIHKLHHMDQQLDVLTSSRQNWIEDFVRIPLLTIPLTILYKLDARQASIAGIFVGFMLISWVIFQHCNIRVHLGWATVVFNGPQYHRIHHSRLPEHVNRNFAGAFPILDVLFGTYYHPARDEFPPTGVDGEVDVQSLAQASALPFLEWWRMLRGRLKSHSASVP